MKTMKRLTSIILAAVMCTLAFASCGPQGGGETTGGAETGENLPGTENAYKREPYDFTTGKIMCIWEDTVYYVERSETGEGATLKYRDVRDTESDGTPVSLAEDNPFTNAGSITVLIDEYATKENGWAPVLLAAVRGVDENEKAKILSLDTKTGEWKVVERGIEGTLVNLWMYRDEVFYTTMKLPEDLTDLAGVVCRQNKINRDGSGSVSVKFGFSDIMNIEWIHGGVIYMNEGNYGKYAYTTDLEETGILLETNDLGQMTIGEVSVGNIEYVTDEYIYFNGVTGSENTYLNMYRCSHEFTDCELVFEDCGFLGDVCGDRYIYEKSTDELYIYDFATGEERELFAVDDPEGKSITINVSGIGDDYVICSVYEFAGEGLDADGMEIYTVCIDLLTGESWRMPI